MSNLAHGNKPVAVLSSTLLIKDGTYKVETLDTPPALDGVPHYVWHPATARILETLGAEQSSNRLFSGLEEGQCAVCVSIRQGFSNRVNAGVTNPNQEVIMEELDFRLLRRLE